jgi:flagellar motility protein MotE (MotC chaperone)
LHPAGNFAQWEGSLIATDDTKTKAPSAPAKHDPKAENGEAAADGADTGEVKKGKKLGPVTLIVAALLSFVIFLGVFSYTMGVFDPAPEPTAEQAASGSENADEGQAPADDYVSDYGQAAAAVEAARSSNSVDTIAELSLLERRQREIAAEEKAIASQKKELEELRAEVEKLLGKKAKVADEKVTYIAKLIDGMKADEMSGLITNLDNATILAVLPKMKPQTASRVLSLLPPKRAAEITKELLFTEPRAEIP